MDLQVCYTVANVCVQWVINNYNEEKKNGVNVQEKYVIKNNKSVCPC